jgi:hypothetical protein
MATFLERYVRVPIQALPAKAPEGRSLPAITFRMTETALVVDVEGDVWEVARDARPE